MGATTSHHEPLDRSGIRLSRRYNKTFSRSFRDKSSKKSGSSPRRMDRLRRSFRDSFRKRKEHVPESSKPHQWQADEIAVRQGNCNFQVKYLGCVEVFESRGMQVCEEALKVLRGNTRRRPVKAILYVSGDGLRVVEDETKGLIVDQTIEKVSFCAPDRNHEKGFSYICRDGTTRRWMCHGFLALKESGERLSHAVGCAFAACLERKQKRDKECGVTMTFDSKNSVFTRSGSFRHTTLTDRLKDPQEIKPGADPPPMKPVYNPYAIERPHATPSMLQRQGSFRGFSQLPGASPFKRQLSLRVSELPSNLERQRSLSLEGNDIRLPPSSMKSQVSPIPELSAITDKGASDPVSAMCQQLSQGLSLLSSEDFIENKDPAATANQLNSFQTKIDSYSFQSNTTPPWSASSSNNSWDSSRNNAAVSLSNVKSLPKPDQWLGTIVANTSTTTSPSPSPTPRRTPPLAHLRAHSLGSDNFFSPRTRQNQLNGILDYNTNQTNIFSSDTLSNSAALQGSQNSIASNSSSGIGTNSGTVSLNSGTFNSSQSGTAESKPKDPFDAEWASVATKGDEATAASTNPFIVPSTIKSFEVHL
ncbi:UNVERIFIED_CONTAM: hypothetical protein PYX00_009417 [Menopon gallinae]|uniref:PID domain-containing protein n=1 Tax=Menopon gallinae TaxID=328185 RepID=A0AAW2HBV7_9NEOP